ncbi:hypothetical protein [Cupriavidus necator]|uniref:hypothetical protein n=1 Tax=Cupriavidus necator TaxID=106590 RepID=UPI00339D7E7D
MSRAFSPNPGTTVSIAATTASTSVSVATDQDKASAVRVYNAGPNDVRVRWGAGAQTAVSGDVRVPAGAVEVFSKGNADTIAAKCDSGTATVEFTTGEGL